MIELTIVDKDIFLNGLQNIDIITEELNDLNDNPWLITYADNGVIITYIGDDVFINDFITDSDIYENTGCIALKGIDINFKVMITSNYTDDIWDIFEELLNIIVNE